MSEYTIYTYPGSLKSAKALIAAKYAGIDIHVPPFNMGVDNKTPEFLEKFPHGKVPGMITPDGPIWESNAMARYVARNGGVLMGNNNYEASLIDQWMDYSNEFSGPLFDWVAPILGYAPYCPNKTEAGKKSIARSLIPLEKHLEKHTYLVGESISLADICVAMELTYFFKIVFDDSYRQGIPNITRWYKEIIVLPNVTESIGQIEFCTEAMVAKEAK